MPKLSIILPIYNEAPNIRLLFDKLQAVALQVPEYEIIAVDDGSRDNSWEILSQIAHQDKHVKLIRFSRNHGQTAALSAGITHSEGDIIVPLDSDLENDPADIPRLLKKMDEGYDVVSGWRLNRWPGKWLSRKLPSAMANWLISRIAGLKLHDYGCTLKAYKRELIQDVSLYGEMHRFIPALAAWQQGRVAELPVHYEPRKHGASNYGISRTFRVILDLVLIKFLSKYMNRPMHFFGGIGFITFSVGLLSGIVAIILRVFEIRDFVATPLPVFSALFIIVGVQLIVMGVLAEMIMRIYYESQNKNSYVIKNKINFNHGSKD